MSPTAVSVRQEGGKDGACHHVHAVARGEHAPLAVRSEPSASLLTAGSARWQCELICHSNSKHLQYIYTGFSLLRRRGLIDLRQRIANDAIVLPQRVQHLRNARHAHLKVIVNGALRLHYDTHDSEDIDEEYLAQADYYFKRSYSEAHLRRRGYDTTKIRPLGLYYEVYPDGMDVHRWIRILKLERGLETRARKLVHAVPKMAAVEALPDYAAPPRILLNLKAWDPFDQPDRLQEKVEERIRLNDMRAQCLRMLRSEFGPAFSGGFVHSAYARRHYPDLLLPDQEAASKHNYLRLLKSFPICVATTGLHGSIGAKFAEYVCLAKAILSERLLYIAPGDLREELNYLPFSTAEECVAQARRLFDDADLRHRLMSNNARYYNASLRPDALVLNTLLRAA